jgi:cell division protein FtsZ
MTPPLPQAEERPVSRKEESRQEAEEETQADSSTEEQLRKSRERIMKLKELSYRIGNANNLADMEKEPAYKRRNIKLDSVPHSSETNISRYTLSNEEEKKSEIKPNNSFLHDNVD